MRYANSSERPKLGHIVTNLTNAYVGKLVGIISEGVYAEEYQNGGWERLQDGILVEDFEVGLIHDPGPNDDLVFIEDDTSAV